MFHTLWRVKEVASFCGVGQLMDLACKWTVWEIIQQHLASSIHHCTRVATKIATRILRQNISLRFLCGDYQWVLIIMSLKMSLDVHVSVWNSYQYFYTPRFILNGMYMYSHVHIWNIKCIKCLIKQVKVIIIRWQSLLQQQTFCFENKQISIIDGV